MSYIEIFDYGISTQRTIKSPSSQSISMSRGFWGTCSSLRLGLESRLGLGLGEGWVGRWPEIGPPWIRQSLILTDFVHQARHLLQLSFLEPYGMSRLVLLTPRGTYSFIPHYTFEDNFVHKCVNISTKCTQIWDLWKLRDLRHQHESILLLHIWQVVAVHN